MPVRWIGSLAWIMDGHGSESPENISGYRSPRYGLIARGSSVRSRLWIIKYPGTAPSGYGKILPSPEIGIARGLASLIRWVTPRERS